MIQIFVPSQCCTFHCLSCEHAAYGILKRKDHTGHLVVGSKQACSLDAVARASKGHSMNVNTATTVEFNTVGNTPVLKRQRCLCANMHFPMALK